MNSAIRRLVFERALHRCEYCHLPQAAAPFIAFHVEHIVALQHLQDDSENNLALACPDCNRYKGPNLTSVDPETRQLVRLFHPRQDRWEDHFEYQGPLIIGLSDIGTATVRLLDMNSRQRILMRLAIMQTGEM